MSSVPWLTIAGAIPLAGALVLTAIPSMPANGVEADREARNLLCKRLALGFSVLTLAWFIAMAVQFKPNGPNFQFNQTVSWIPEFGVHYAVGVDGIALVLIGMSVVLMPVVILASWHDAEETRRSVPAYFALLLTLEFTMLGVFAVSDVFLFYLFF